MNNKQERTKGKYIAQSVFSLIAAILMALILFVAFFTDLQYLFGGATNIDRMLERNGGELEKGEYVSVGVDAVVDWYAETKHTINGFIPAGREQHCIIWLNDSSFVSLTVKGKKNIEKIDKLIDETYRFINGETDSFPTPVVFEGKVTSIGSEVNQYFNDAVSEYGLYGQNVHYLTIDTTSTKGQIVLFGLLFILLIVFFVALFVSGIKGAKGLKEAERAAAMASQPYGTQGLDAKTFGTQDFNGGQYQSEDNNNFNNYNM